jgi:DNA-binding NtrC family response regulator
LPATINVAWFKAQGIRPLVAKAGGRSGGHSQSSTTDGGGFECPLRHRRRSVAYNILIVDDEPHIRYLIQKVLLDEHYEVDAASSGLEALQKLAVSSVDLAIVDLCLPDLTGLDLAEAIRMLDPGTPVILITAYGTPAFELIASHPAISHYVHKPFALERLLSLVHQSIPM